MYFTLFSCITIFDSLSLPGRVYFIVHIFHVIAQRVFASEFRVALAALDVLLRMHFGML